VNAESGIFGIIKSVNERDDPLIWQVLTNPGEVIFSNILVKDGVPYWQGDGRAPPEEGVNFFGKWRGGVKDSEGNEVPIAHANARYSIRLSDIENLDPRADDPAGVEVGGVIFGGRDSDTSVPVQQSFDWAHGVITMGAALESESTAATIGKTGVLTFQPMSIQDFLSIYLGRYITNYLEFGSGLETKPLIFAVNYFLRDAEGEYVTDMKDKYVWVKWMERRVHGELGAVKTPTGYIPRHEDLVPLFGSVLDRDYPRDLYRRQFTVRVLENIKRTERIREYYEKKVPDASRIIRTVFAEQLARLKDLRRRKGDYVSPFDLAGAD
jgi:phosphoenolpyruvate carboxykinase (GTP)